MTPGEDPHVNASASGPPRASASLVLVATFTLGMIAGAAILHLARPAPGPFPPAGPVGPPPVERLQRELGLDATQMDELDRILASSRESMRGEAERTRERIREILTPEQRERFDAMRPPPPPGPGPGPGRPGPPPRRPPPRR